MEEIEFYCKKCKCSMHMSYTTCGNNDTPVLTGIRMKCHRCKKVSVLKNFTEGRIIAEADSKEKFYI